MLLAFLQTCKLDPKVSKMRLCILAATLALVARHATADINFCAFVNPIVPHGCSTSTNCDSITCPVTLGRYFTLAASIDLDVCKAPASVGLSVGLESPLKLKWSEEWRLGTVSRIRP